MNKALLEFTTSQYHIESLAFVQLLPLLSRFLAGENLQMERSPIELSSYNLSTKTLEGYTHSKPHLAIQELEDDSIILLKMNGVLSKYDNCGWYGTQSYASLVNTARQSDHVKGLVIIADSPGGNAEGSLDLAYAVANFKAAKPIVTYVDGQATSAMYRVAANSTHIISKPGSTVGSIGTMVSIRDYTRAEKNAGIEHIMIEATGSPDKNAIYKNLIAGNVEFIQKELLDPMNSLFLEEMKATRNLPDHVLTGKVYFPDEALEHGMIDSVGMLEDAIAICQELIQTQSNSNKPQNHLNMKLKFPAILATFLGLTAETESMTQEQVDQLSAELGTLQAVKAERDSAIADSQAAQAELATLTETHQASTEELETLRASNQALQDRISELEQEVERLGEEPAADPSTPPAGASEHAVALNELPAEAQAIIKSHFPNL